MKLKHLLLLSLTSFFLFSCNQEENNEVRIPNFNYPESITFESSLSAYNIFDGVASDLSPSSEYHLLELSSVLFTDYAYKQRLVKLPSGEKMSKLSDGRIDFPDGTILVKTFYYYEDERDTSGDKNIIETRLLIKENDTWNIATYEWNNAQTDASLSLQGVDKQISWVDKNGSSQSTQYHLPSQNECITCHQSDDVMKPIGPTVRNLNRDVERDVITTNQLDYFMTAGLLESLDPSTEATIVDYKDETQTIQDRGRAYLDMNCSHCHNPAGWERCAQQDLDFRYETSLAESGIQEEKSDIHIAFFTGEMPFIGTTMIDEEGAQLMIEYLESL